MRRCPNCNHPLSARRTRQQTKRTYHKGEHEYLVGMEDHQRRRAEIYRNAGGEVELLGRSENYEAIDLKPATCQGCVEPHLISWEQGEWHHNVKSHGGKRCDCAACGLFLCPMIHEFYRNKVIPVIQR